MRSRAAERRQIHSLGREPQDTNDKILRKPRSGGRNIAVIPAAHGTDRCLSPPPGASCRFVVLTLGLRTAFGRRDAPSPASGRWPAIPDLGHVSLPPAGSRPRVRICRAFGAQIRASLRRVFMEVVRRVATYFRTRQLPEMGLQGTGTPSGPIFSNSQRSRIGMPSYPFSGNRGLCSRTRSMASRCTRTNR